jgi:magnesium transporter
MDERVALIYPPVPVAMVRKLLHRGARSSLVRMFSKSRAADAAKALSLLGSSERAELFSILLDECEASKVAEILTEMDAELSSSLLERLDPQKIAQLFSNMSPDDATSLASKLPEPLAGQVISCMEAQPAADVRELLEYKERTAGRIMTPNYFALEEDVTISEAITALQRRSEEFEMVFYLYVVDRRDHLVGVVSLRKLLTTPPHYQLKRIMVTDVIKVRADASQEEVARLVAQYNLLAIPVVDEDDRLIGIVTVDDVIDVLEEETAADLLALAGVAAEEKISTPVPRSLRLRAPWLLVNLATAFLASWVVNLFEAQIGELPVLAVLMPIVAGMGGNAATQTLAVMVRGIALDELLSITGATIKEVLLGIGNGMINGLVCAAVVVIYFKNVWLGAVIAAAMVINLVVAGVSGTLVPVALKKMGIDPAIASSIFVTTCTDVAGFFSFLGIATLLLHMLKVG